MADPTHLGLNAERVRDLYRKDIPVRQIAILLGLSTQRVYQLLEALRRHGELEEAS